MTDEPTSPELEAIRARLDHARAALALFEDADFLTWRDKLFAEAAANGDTGSGNPWATGGAAKALAELRQAVIVYAESIAQRVETLEAEQAAELARLTAPPAESEGAADEGGGGAPEA